MDDQQKTAIPKIKLDNQPKPMKPEADSSKNRVEVEEEAAPVKPGDEKEKREIKINQYQEGQDQVNNPALGAEQTKEAEKKLRKLGIWRRIKKPAIGMDNSKKKILTRVLLAVGAALFVFLVALGICSLIVFQSAKKVLSSAKALERAVKEEQDIARIKEEIGHLRNDLGGLKRSLGVMIWVRPIPILGGYVKDANAGVNAGLYAMDAAEIVVTTIEPYADIIGFTSDSAGPQSGEESANDRVEFIVETIDQIIPQMDQISEKVQLVQQEVSKINPNRYPAKIGDREVRNQIRDGIALVDDLAKMIGNSKPLLEAAPYILGIEDPRTYLVLFQNDKELRPTGGFITAYSIMTVDEGKFAPVASDDIYHLDNRYKPTIPAPDPIIRYLKGPYVLSKNLRLRDMNFDPDFGTSMEMFAEEVQKTGVKEFDGIIAVDTHVLVKILDVLGQIGVPGFGNFSTENDERCNCPQVIYELEDFADTEGAIVWDQLDPTKIIFAPPNYENRKKIVGPLMNSLLANALGQPLEKLPDLFMAAWESVTEKHVLFYLFDDQAQAGVEAFNLAGRIQDFDGDYLYINDANLGGRKSNLYVTQEVNQEIEVKAGGTVEKTLTITYKNPQSYDGWLNSVLPNWTRIYLPEGSEIISVDGFSDPGETYQEHGKTVVSGGFELRPEGVVKITVDYKLPSKVKDEYKLLVQKQPGTDNPLYTIHLNRQEEELFLKTDKEFRFKI